MIGILPAAGHARRLGLAGQSKELLDVGGLPVIEYSLRRLDAAGCDEVRLVVRPEKADLHDYARRRGLRIVPGRPAHVGASVALALSGLHPEAEVALAFPDTLWEPLDGFARVRACLSGDYDVALGLFETPDAARSDVVVLDEDGAVTDVLVKPAQPPGRLIWGCLVARAAALAGCARSAELSDALRPAIRAGRVVGCTLSDVWLDVGLPESLERARAGFPSVSA